MATLLSYGSTRARHTELALNTGGFFILFRVDEADDDGNGPLQAEE
jgi:hypothetical protein